MAKVNKEKETVELNTVRQQLREIIKKKHGSMELFFSSTEGKKLGGIKSRVYLYDNAAVNYQVLAKLCEHFGIGKLTRNIVVTRTITYELSK